MATSKLMPEALHRQSVSATGGGTRTLDLSPFDESMASIVGEASVAGLGWGGAHRHG